MKAVKFVLMLPVYFIGILVIYFIFTVLNKAYWDAQVRHLCETEGGVTVYESVDLDVPEYASLPKTLSGIPFISDRATMKSGDPFYFYSKTDDVEEFGGITFRSDKQHLVRASDEKILATKIYFSRRGGDFATIGGPGTSFSCDHISDRRTALTDQTFYPEGR